MRRKANQSDLFKFLIKTRKLIWFVLVLNLKKNQSDLVRHSSTLIQVLVRFQDLFENVFLLAVLASFLNYKYFKYPNWPSKILRKKQLFPII
jgi:hypothetical protein